MNLIKDMPEPENGIVLAFVERHRTMLVYRDDTEAEQRNAGLWERWFKDAGPDIQPVTWAEAIQTALLIYSVSPEPIARRGI